jgi:hypothetical protein
MIRRSCLHSADFWDGKGIAAQTACQRVCRFGRITSAPLIKTSRLLDQVQSFPQFPRLQLKPCSLCNKLPSALTTAEVPQGLDPLNFPSRLNIRYLEPPVWSPVSDWCNGNNGNARRFGEYLGLLEWDAVSHAPPERRVPEDVNLNLFQLLSTWGF